ncbi:MAG: hypothetical protein NC302_06055 [Bacteroidales bacterium]|nr:hypothetical protein [Bacteroidales bacterium]MCM1416688.1 hypothetical protein [bacterium]MCM1424003.1 hypothetical protein [bacterium]
MRNIFYVDRDTIQILTSAGTYASYCLYYDIVNDRFSEWYENPIAAGYHRVALPPFWGDERPLIIKDMFGEGDCYQEFFLDFADVL